MKLNVTIFIVYWSTELVLLVIFTGLLCLGFSCRWWVGRNIEIIIEQFHVFMNINKWMFGAVRLTFINGIYCKQQLGKELPSILPSNARPSIELENVSLLTKIFNAPALWMDMLRQISFSDLCFSVMHFPLSLREWLIDCAVSVVWVTSKQNENQFFGTTIHLTRKWTSGMTRSDRRATVV